MVKIGELLLHLRLLQTDQPTSPINFLRVSALVYLTIASISEAVVARATDGLMVDVAGLCLGLFEEHVIDFVRMMRLVQVILLILLLSQKLLPGGHRIWVIFFILPGVKIDLIFSLLLNCHRLFSAYLRREVILILIVMMVVAALREWIVITFSYVNFDFCRDLLVFPPSLARNIQLG